MTRITLTQSQRARPSARAQRISTGENAPVLFRLPIIESVPLAPVEDGVASLNFVAHAVEGGVASGLPGGPVTTPIAHAISPVAAYTGTTPQESSEEPLRSWWEHWSSGVVMIVLAVVLVAISLKLFRSPGRQTPSTIASTKTDNEFGDLESIAVPAIAVTESDAEIRSQSIPNQTAGLESVIADAELAQPLSGADLVGVDVTPPADESTKVQSENDGPGLSGLELSVDQRPADPTATANLLQPTPPSAQPSGFGQSPTLYDEASRQSMAIDAGLAPSTANRPTASSMPNLGTGNPAIPPITLPVSTSTNSLLASQPDGQATNVPGGNVAGTPISPSLRATATPDSNDEDIIRAYLELTRTAPPQTEPSPATPQSNAPVSNVPGSTNTHFNRYQN